MSIPKIILLAFYAFGALTSVSMIGKPRDPITPALCTATLFLTGIMVWLVVIA